MAQPDPMADIRASFFDECDELIEAYQDGLDDLGRGGGGPETVNALFRCVHSIKGGAATFGFDALTACAHELENVLAGLRDAQALPSLDMIADLLRSGDRLAELISAARTGRTPEPKVSAADETVREVRPVYSDTKNNQRQATRLTFHPASDFWKADHTFTEVVAALSDHGDVNVSLDETSIPSLQDFDPERLDLRWQIEIEPKTDPTSLRDWISQCPAAWGLTVADNQVPRATTEKAKSQTPPPPEQRPTIRVELDRIDRLINLVGELVINQAMLAQAMETSDLGDNHLYSSGLDDFLRLTRDLQDSVMQIRAQPVKPLFMRMARICRETADTLGKPVELRMDGAETEIDKTVIERLADPLTHMIRNAIDHGIEPAADRAAAGKPAHGELRLRAFHRSGQVIVELSDDGAGINRAGVLKKAQDQGLIAAHLTPPDAEIDALLFHPGLSTAKSVSGVSGRGVGMDVVRSAIHALGGRLTVDSQPGQGTRFSIALPLTLAVLDSMIIGVHEHTMVLPLSAIQETLHIRQTDVLEMTSQTGQSQQLLRYDNRVIPLFDLAHELGFAPRRADLEGVIALIVTHEDTASSAIIIDEILEQRQVVIKGLQDGFATHPCIAAATILGDGSIALIVDPYELIPGTAHGSTQATVPLAQTG